MGKWVKAEGPRQMSVLCIHQWHSVLRYASSRQLTANTIPPKNAFLNSNESHVVLRAHFFFSPPHKWPPTSPNLTSRQPSPSLLSLSLSLSQPPLFIFSKYWDVSALVQNILPTSLSAEQLMRLPLHVNHLSLFSSVSMFTIFIMFLLLMAPSTERVWGRVAAVKGRGEGRGKAARAAAGRKPAGVERTK